MKLPKADWHPTKYENYRGRWRAAREGGVASRLMTDLQAAGYQRAIECYAQGSLIDLGCGNAPLTALYASRVDGYSWADWPNSPHQKFQLDHEIDLNDTLPFGASSFDTILLSDVLEHVANPERLFAQLATILKPGGHLIVGVPFLYQLHEQPHDYHRYTSHKLRHFGEIHALEVIEVYEVGGGLDCLADLSGKLAAAIWEPLARFPYYLWTSFRHLSSIRRLNQRAAVKFPLAYVAVYRRP